MSTKSKEAVVRFVPSHFKKKPEDQPKETRLNAKQVEQFRERVRSVVDAGKKASIDICQLVYESYVNITSDGKGWKYCWQLWGYESWEEFVGQEMDLHVTTAYSYARVWEIFYVKYAGKWDTDLLLGITKMKHLAAYKDLNAKNVNSVLRQAKKMNCRALVAMIYNREETRALAFHLTKTQMKTMHRIFEGFKESLNEGEKMTRTDMLLAMARTWEGLPESRRMKLRLVGSSKAA